MEPAPHDVVASLSSRYRIERPLGRGGMATVYLAEDLKHGRKVAIKVLDPEVAAAIGPWRFRREIEFAARLTHPHILPLHDSGVAGDRLYYITPFIEGESLRVRLDRDGPLPIPEAMKLAGEIASALDYAHAQGLVHRDIKPENVLLAHGVALVADFGIARAVDAADPRATTTGVVMGTPLYMSPEQAMAGPDLDGRSDLYSLGCVVFEMLTGAPPFTGRTTMAILARHLSEAVPDVRALRADVPEAVQGAIERAMSKSPADRFETAGAFAAALRSAGATTPTRVAAPAGSGNLKPEPTSFVGREREAAALEELLGTTRLLTLTGAGGCGKTRLAARLGAAQLDRRRSGVWFVDLAPLVDAARVTQALAGALGVREESNQALSETLVEHLRERDALLILDNCEHVVDAVAPLAEELLGAAPSLAIVATSREPLRVPGEVTYAVPPLAVPDPRRPGTIEALSEVESVRLFVERAAQARPGFGVTEANAAAVAQICYRLDGIPLAIELAAARVRALAVEEIARRLDDRFHLLTRGSRTALPRHQTLRAAFDWGWDLLAENERSLWRRLSVFAGGWRLEDAEAVCSDAAIGADEVLDLLTALVERSLVATDGDGGRFRQLETVRQYGGGRLEESGEGESVRARHLDRFLALGEQAEPELSGPGQVEWLRRLEDDRDNLRAALRWGLTGPEHVAAALRLAGALSQFWAVRGDYTEGRAWLKEALERPEAQSLDRVKALSAAGTLAMRQGDYPEAQRRFEAALAIHRARGAAGGVARALSSLGIAAFCLGNYDAARARSEEALAIWREAGDRRGMASALNNLGIVAYDRGRYGEARERYQEALASHRESGDRRGIAHALQNLAIVCYAEGDFASVRAHGEEALAIYRDLEDRPGIAGSLNQLGNVAVDRGEYAEARGRFEDALAIYREVGDKRGLAIVLRNLGDVASNEGDPEAAQRHYREALAIQRAIGDRRGAAATLAQLGEVASALEGDHAAGWARLEEALAIQREIDDRQGVAASLSGLGAVALRRADPDRAAACLAEALTLQRAMGEKPSLARTLERAAKLEIERGRFDEAALLLGAASALLDSVGTTPPPYERDERTRAVEAARAALGSEGLERSLASGRAMVADEAVERALAGHASA